MFECGRRICDPRIDGAIGTHIEAKERRSKKIDDAEEPRPFDSLHGKPSQVEPHQVYNQEVGGKTRDIKHDGNREVDDLKNRMDSLEQASEATFRQHEQMLDTLKELFETVQAGTEVRRQDVQAKTTMSHGLETNAEQEHQSEMLKDIVISRKAHAAQMDALQQEVHGMREQLKDFREQYEQLRMNTCTLERAREIASDLEEAKQFEQLRCAAPTSESPGKTSFEHNDEEEEEEVAVDSKSMLLRELQQSTRAVDSSTWEAVIFFGHNWFGWTPAIVAILCGIINVGVQLLFCALVEETLTNRDMPSEASLEFWRAQAHDNGNVDPVTGLSLVSRVCGLDSSLSVAGVQTSFIQNAEDYVGRLEKYAIVPQSFRAGPTMFAVSWFLWLMCALQEVMSCFEFMYALLALPRGTTQMLITKEGFAIRKISLRSLFGIFLMQGCRIYVCIQIFASGSMWLANETDIKNLVLNAAALSFIMDLDEMIYTIAMPSVVQSMLSNLEPLRLPTHTNSCLHWFTVQVGFRPIFFVLASVSTFLYFWAFYITRNVSDLIKAHDALCKGETDWVYTYTEFDLMIAKRTPAYTTDYVSHPISLRQKYIQDGAKQLWMRSTDEQRNNWIAWLTPRESTFNEFALKSVGELNQVQGIVKDQCFSYDLFMSSDPLFVISSLSRQTEVANPEGCISMVHACGLPASDWLRSRCPTQCGCDSPLSGLYFGGPARGCPSLCIEAGAYLHILNQLDCKDIQPAPKLRELWLTGWRRYWNDFVMVQSAQGDMLFPNASDQAANATTWECRILASSQARSFFCFASDDVTPLTKFCPVACGCLEFPTLPGCPPACQIHDTTYKDALSNAPCDDVQSGFLNIELYSEFRTELLRRYDGSWKQAEFDAIFFQSQWFVELFANTSTHTIADAIMAYVNMTGCDFFQESLGSDFAWFCSAEIFGLRVFCPQACGCKERPNTLCPDKCFL